MATTILLPAHHVWRESDLRDATCYAFECERCSATFIHDLMEGVTVFEDGEGTCEPDDEEVA